MKECWNLKTIEKKVERYPRNAQETPLLFLSISVAYKLQINGVCVRERETQDAGRSRRKKERERERERRYLPQPNKVSNPREEATQLLLLNKYIQFYFILFP